MVWSGYYNEQNLIVRIYFGGIKNVAYTNIVINFWSTQIRNGNSSKDPVYVIDIIKNIFIFYIYECKNALLKPFPQKCKYERRMNAILKLQVIK